MGEQHRPSSVTDETPMTKKTEEESEDDEAIVEEDNLFILNPVLSCRLLVDNLNRMVLDEKLSRKAMTALENGLLNFVGVQPIAH